jgi:CDP-glycerol glycerophosphotransferase
MRKLFLYSLNTVLYWISGVFPKNKNIWIFGAWFGGKYSDNSRYLFEYINKNHSEIRAVWVTDSLDVINELNAKNYEVYKRYSVQSILIGLRAKYSIFVQANIADCMAFLNNKNTFNIQLWHGMPLKKIGFDDSISIVKYRKSNLKELIFPFLRIKYSLIISSSMEDKVNFSTAFMGQYKSISITGYPRNDALFNIKKTDNFIITYLPTFRDSAHNSVDLFSPYNFDIELWEQKFLDLNVTLNIKMHPVNKPKSILLSTFKDCKRIRFIDEMDAVEILSNTDILITDYSSVYFDYLLLDKPIIFSPFDYEKYVTKDREFYYNYHEVTPGPKCRDWTEVLEWIERFKKDSMLYSEKRKKVRGKFHKYQDARSCERVYGEIIKLNNN